jgi:hypothetical protein
MKTLTIEVLDDSKFQLVREFLQEIRFIRIETPSSASKGVKTMKTLPPSLLHPHKAKIFRWLSREDLHERENVRFRSLFEDAG